MKITVEFDTVAKTLLVAKDGEAVPDVAGVWLGKEYDYYSDRETGKFTCELMQASKDDENGTKTMIRTVAAEDAFIPAGPASSQLAHDIASFLTKKK
jgi:hypothetical protein